jgi:hypothetical protein
LVPAGARLAVTANSLTSGVLPAGCPRTAVAYGQHGLSTTVNGLVILSTIGLFLYLVSMKQLTAKHIAQVSSFVNTIWLLAFSLLYTLSVDNKSTGDQTQTLEQDETGDTQMNILNALRNDENGFIVSAELVLVGTILVLGMIVGLTELSFNVNEELEDLGSAIGGLNQTYYYTLSSGHKGESVGSTFLDFADECDNACNITCNSPGRREVAGY